MPSDGPRSDVNRLEVNVCQFGSRVFLSTDEVFWVVFELILDLRAIRVDILTVKDELQILMSILTKRKKKKKAINSFKRQKLPIRGVYSQG